MLEPLSLLKFGTNLLQVVKAVTEENEATLSTQVCSYCKYSGTVLSMEIRLCVQEKGHKVQKETQQTTESHKFKALAGIFVVRLT